MEEQMKSLWTLAVLVGLVVVVAVTPALAQMTFNGADLEVKFTAPMAFYVGDKLMPAGAYEIKQGAGAQANTLLVRGKGKNEAYVEFTAVASEAPVKKMDVTFNKYGNKEYLNSIKYASPDPTQGSFILKINPSAGEQAAAQAAAAAAHTIPATGKK
jgi:predicted HicB family RNase H-like nuclease